MNIIVVFPKLEDVRGIKSLLTKRGFYVAAACTTGAQALSSIDNLDEGIIICGYRLLDMLYKELNACLPPHFEMLLLASQRYLSEGEENGIISLPIPIKTNDFINTIDMMIQSLIKKKRRLKEKPKRRTEEEKKIIDMAKHILIERNNMTELEAHRYIQKCSMDTGRNMIETAQMILKTKE